MFKDLQTASVFGSTLPTHSMAFASGDGYDTSVSSLPSARHYILLGQTYCWHYIFLGTRLRKSIKNVYDQTDVCLCVFWENRILAISSTIKVTFSLQAAAYQLFYYVTGRKTAGLSHSAGWCFACFPWEENTQPCNDWRSWKLSHPQLPAANCDWLNLLLSCLFSAQFWRITSVLF